jgi:hypothetical protein
VVLLSRFSDDGRARLHADLDWLMDAVDALEPDSQEAPLDNGLAYLLAGNTPPPAPTLHSQDLLSCAVGLVRQVLGERVLTAALELPVTKSESERRQLRHWLHSFSSLLIRSNGYSPGPNLYFGIMDALSALEAGEIRPIFKANTGRNRKANIWTLATCKLEALAWKKRLVALGHHEKSANYEVTQAFREQWDTIRRWLGQCERVLGRDRVVFMLHHAGGPSDAYVHSRKGMIGRRPPLDPVKGLSDAGARYRNELARTAELSADRSGHP